MPRETSQSGQRLECPPRPPVEGDLAGFALALGLLREWAGLTIQALENKDREALPHTTTGNYLRGKGVPRWEWLHAYVTACLAHGGLTAAQIAIELDCWKAAWLRVRVQQISPATEGNTLVGNAEDAHQPTAGRWTPRRVKAAVIAGVLVAGGLVLVAVRPWSSSGVCGPTVEHEYSSYAYRFTPCWAGGITVVWFRDMEGDGYCVIGQVTFWHRTGFGTPKPLPPRACPATDEKGKRVELRSPADTIGAEVSFALSADSTALLSPAPATPTPACPLTVVPLPPSVNPGLRIVLFAETGCPLWQAGYGCPDDTGRDVWQLPTHVALASHDYRLDFARHVCTVKIYNHPEGTGTGTGCTLSAGSKLPLADAVKGRAFSVVVLRDPQEQKC